MVHAQSAGPPAAIPIAAPSPVGSGKAWLGALLCGIVLPAAGAAPGTSVPVPTAPVAGDAAAVRTGAADAPVQAPPRLPVSTTSTDAIDEPLTAVPGDAARGREIVVNRQLGLCLLCHTGPFPEERFQGNLAPDLGGAGARWSAGQLRLRLVDGRRLNPQTIMPAYHRDRDDGLARVGSAWQGKPLLSAQQVEDVVAFLRTLQ